MYVAAVTVNAVMPHRGIQLNLFRFTQREKEITADFQPDGIDWLMKSPPAASFISRPKETTFAMEMLLLKTLIMAIVSSACDTIAITLSVMTPCITPNLVFRILSPWNGWVEGAGRGPGQGSAEAEAERGHRQRPTFSQ